MSRHDEVILENELDRVSNKLLALRAAARKCRDAQTAYFKDRSKENLVTAKQAEKLLDGLLQ